MQYEIKNGDSLEVLQRLDENSIDSIVCDPPYGLSFMNKQWDYDVPTTDLWKQALRVLKPGGHLLAFFGSRTYHRGVVALEDAGFEIRNMLGWVYGSGFPKSHNIGKYYEKKMRDGKCRDVINKGIGDTNGRFFQSGKHIDGREEIEVNNEWEGWGTGLKPALEPIVMARKPMSEKSIVDNVIEWGVGGINIDGCRIPNGDETFDHVSINKNELNYGVAGGPNLKPGGNAEAVKKLQEQGRFPANFIHDGIQEDWGKYFYVAKASKNEKNAGLDEFDDKRKAAGDFRPSYDQDGSDGTAYGRWGNTKNDHPTIKPIALMEHLITLVTPPNGTVLDPFCGSGSTGCAAAKLGFNFVGIELDEDYCEIAKARIEHWKDQECTQSK